MYQDERQFHNRQLINSIPNADSFDSLKKYIKLSFDDKVIIPKIGLEIL